MIISRASSPCLLKGFEVGDMPIVNSRMTSGTLVVFHRNAASGLGLGLGCAVLIVVIVLRVWVYCVKG